jgi:hypothetical protein
MLRRAAFVLLLTVLFSSAFATTNGCGGISGPTEINPSLSGVVRDEQGRAVRAVTVSVGANSSESDINGLYHLASVDIGTVTVVARKEGYALYRAQLETGGGDNRHDITLRLQ